jgi:ABC-type multidrug transport system fused ATPase/permease subunit
LCAGLHDLSQLAANTGNIFGGTADGCFNRLVWRTAAEVFPPQSKSRLQLIGFGHRGIQWIRLVQAFAAEDYEIARFGIEAEHNRKAKYAAEHLKAIQLPVVGFMYVMSVLLLLFLGGWQIAQGNLTGAKFVSYIASVGLLIDPITHITSNYNEFKQGEASVDRIFELVAVQPTVVEKPGATVLPPVTGKVEYRNISFAYPSYNPPTAPSYHGGK